MKKLILNYMLAVVSIGTAGAQESGTFIHKAFGNNTSGNWTEMRHENTDSNANIAMLVTHNSNPTGSKSLIHDHKVGLFYSLGTWRVFNEDFTKLDTGLAFNIFVPGVDVKSWVHVADSNNSSNNHTEINHPVINGDSAAIIFISDIWNYNNKPGVYNPNVMGVYYKNSTKKWCIFHQDNTKKMVMNSSYSIIIPEKSSKIKRFVHRSNKVNTVANTTLIDHPDANNNPDAQIFITQNWNPNKGPGKYNNNNVGVFYNGTRWAIYNESLNTMDTAVSFNVMIYSDKTNSLTQQTMNSQIHMFPNPVQNGDHLEVIINSPIQGGIDIEILDLTGKTLLSQPIIKDKKEWTESLLIDGLAKGIYLLKISHQSFSSTQRFVIE